MNFEQEYYENESFWEGNMLQDEENKKRIEFTLSFIPSEVSSLCDVGCGNGVFVNFLSSKRKDIKILAIDRSANALKYVITNKMQADCSNLSLPSHSFDCVSCLEVIEHLPIGIFEKTLSELSRIAKEYIIISVPFEEDLEHKHNQCPKCKTIFNENLHMRSFDDRTMTGLLKEVGFSLIRLDHLGKSSHLKGHHKFRKILYKNIHKEWSSPICPLCGYKEVKLENQDPMHTSNKTKTVKSKIFPILTSIPKFFWPKYEKYYWVIGLYKRNN